MGQHIDRRTLLSYGAFGAGLFGAATLARAAVCEATAGQTAGPFYPVSFPADSDADLRQIDGHAQAALGLVVVVEGVVKDAACNPVAGAVVEIWQAASSGKYNDDRDPNPVAADPDFQGWGRVVTSNDGRFRFKTVKPGSYPTDPANPSGWIRPPHIHFQVTAAGAPRLVTQLYFAGEALNDQDQILNQLRQDVGDAKAQEVVVAFTGSGLPADPLHGTFEITVGRAGQRGVTPFLD